MGRGGVVLIPIPIPIPMFNCHGGGGGGVVPIRTLFSFKKSNNSNVRDSIYDFETFEHQISQRNNKQKTLFNFLMNRS